MGVRRLSINGETFLLPLGPRLVKACGIGPGMSVLDVAAGTGNASMPAAERGASVTAGDLTPELLEAGRRHAESCDLEAADVAPERVVLAGREIYACNPQRLQRSPLARLLTDRRLGVTATARNWNTVTKLLSMADE